METIRETSPLVSEIIYKEMEKNGISYHDRILEPSAGEGNLVDYIKERMMFHIPIDVIELNSDKAKALEDKGYNLIGRDYLNTYIDKLYDFIIACPPFKADANLEHIQKMYMDIKRGGTIITLCNTKWVYDNNEKCKKFRQFLNDVDYSIKMLPDNSFVEKGKTVPTMIITIKR